MYNAQYTYCKFVILQNKFDGLFYITLVYDVHCAYIEPSCTVFLYTLQSFKCITMIYVLTDITNFERKNVPPVQRMN